MTAAQVQVAPATAWTAPDLMALQVPPARWAVPGVIPQGVSVLAGPPKIGKSWLMLGVAVAVAAGGQALGRVPVLPGPVLYLALEDTPARLQSRLGVLLAGAPAPEALTISVASPPLAAGGGDKLDTWLARNRAARLIIIDVLARVRRHERGKGVYQADYDAVGVAKSVADRHGVAMVLVHHTRKVASPDFLEEVSGSNGLAGAADAVLLLRRGRGSELATLRVTGRDLAEATHHLRFAGGLWSLREQAAAAPAAAAGTTTRQAILAHLSAHPGQGPAQVARATGLAVATIRKQTSRMVAAGDLARSGRGSYVVCGTTPAGPPG